MTPDQFEEFAKRLIVMGTPKEACLYNIEYRTFASYCTRCTPEVVVLLVILTSFLNVDSLRGRSPFQIIEYFAGVGRIAGFARYAGFRSAAVDLEIGRDKARPRSRPPMDINSSAGLLLLG